MKSKVPYDDGTIIEIDMEIAAIVGSGIYFLQNLDGKKSISHIKASDLMTIDKEDFEDFLAMLRKHKNLCPNKDCKEVEAFEKVREKFNGWGLDS